MDWEDKFTSIVKETERNLAKAKEKLSGKAQNPLSYNSRQDSLKYKSKDIPSPRKEPFSLKEKSSLNYLDGGKIDTSLSNMSTSSIQILHMQEQIDSQNKTIEKLKHLVKSLDGERDYYKEQISLLKGEVDLLTSSMRNKSSFLTSEMKMSNIKREVMDEVEKVKSLVKSFEKDSARHSSALSPRFDPEFWNIKENLASSLEHVRYELNQMKGRIDRMESQLEVDNMKELKFDTRTEPLHKRSYDAPLYTPMSKVLPSVTETDLSHLRTAISSINSKLDNIERKCHKESQVLNEGNLRPSRFSPRSMPFSSKPMDYLFFSDDFNSLADPSDLSDIISEDYDSDGDIDELLDFDDDDKMQYKTTTSSILKKSHAKTDCDEFDLSDLDLSDVDEADEVDFEAASLDLDN